MPQVCISGGRGARGKLSLYFRFWDFVGNLEIIAITAASVLLSFPTAFGLWGRTVNSLSKRIVFCEYKFLALAFFNIYSSFPFFSVACRLEETVSLVCKPRNKDINPKYGRKQNYLWLTIVRSKIVLPLILSHKFSLLQVTVYSRESFQPKKLFLIFL